MPSSRKQADVTGREQLQHPRRIRRAKAISCDLQICPQT